MKRLQASVLAPDPESEHDRDRPLRHSMVVSRDAPLGRAHLSHDRVELFEIRSEEIVGEVVKYVRRMGPSVTVEQGVLTTHGCIVPTTTDDTDLLLDLKDGDFVGGAGATIRLSLHGVEFRVDGKLSRAEQGGWRLSSPRLFNLDQRATERMDLGRGIATLRWSEVENGSLVSRAASVEELSSEGVRLSVRRGASHVPIGSPFAATLDIDGHQIRCLAETRHLREGVSETRCGLKLHASASRGALVDAYLRRRFPQLKRRGDIDPDHVYGLLERSGYLALRDDMRPPREWFARSDDAAISRDVCFRANDGELIGHVSFTRAYPRAWLGHQLATIRQHSEATACRRAIYLHIATYPTLVDGDDAMMVGYYDRGRPWHQRLFTGFVEWLGDPNLAVAYSLDRFERASSEVTSPVKVDGADVGPVRSDELPSATALVRSYLPPLVAAALDIHPDRLQTEMLNADYEGTRYDRGRQALVLRVGGELSGVALCETGSRELSIFNLFNMAQVFILPSASVPAQLMLLGAVRAFYAARNELGPMIVAPPGTFDASREDGTVLAETMGMIVWSGRALRQYENFIKYQFGRQLELVA